MKEHLKRKIEATEMGPLRRICRTSKLDRVRNETIMQQINIKETVLEHIEKTINLVNN